MLYIAFKYYAVQSVVSNIYRHAIWSHLKFMTVNLYYIPWLSCEQHLYHQTKILIIVFIKKDWEIPQFHIKNNYNSDTSVRMFTWTNQSNNFDTIIWPLFHLYSWTQLDALIIYCLVLVWFMLKVSLYLTFHML